MFAARGIRPALFIALTASLALTACDKKRKAVADTAVAHAEVETKLPPSAVSDEFLNATALVAADAVSVPHTEEVIVAPGAVAPAVIPPDNGAAAAPPPDNGAANAQNMAAPEGANMH
jgi:hypothetical protein